MLHGVEFYLMLVFVANGAGIWGWDFAEDTLRGFSSTLLLIKTTIEVNYMYSHYH